MPREVTEVDRLRLGKYVKRDRQRLGLSVRSAAKMAGVDRATWSGLEDGSRTTRDEKYAGIERTLQWQAGSIEDCLNRGEPRPLADSDTRKPHESKPLDPLTSSTDEILEFLEEVREGLGEPEYRELRYATLEVRRLAAERERKTVTRKEHEEL